MPTDACDQCGTAIFQPRNGSQRKRFCSTACRARWNRSRRAAGATPALEHQQQHLDDGAADRLQTLRDLYDRLKADVEEHGTLIPSGVAGALKGNPSVEALRRVILELDRREAEQQAAASRDEPVVDPVEVALRIV